jgi:hypothetical protein
MSYTVIAISIERINPIPAPLGISLVCELLSLGVSIRWSLSAYFIISLIKKNEKKAVIISMFCILTPG